MGMGEEVSSAALPSNAQRQAKVCLPR